MLGWGAAGMELFPAAPFHSHGVLVGASSSGREAPAQVNTQGSSDEPGR